MIVVFSANKGLSSSVQCGLDGKKQFSYWYEVLFAGELNILDISDIALCIFKDSISKKGLYVSKVADDDSSVVFHAVKMLKSEYVLNVDFEDENGTVSLDYRKGMKVHSAKELDVSGYKGMQPFAFAALKSRLKEEYKEYIEQAKDTADDFGIDFYSEELSIGKAILQLMEKLDEFSCSNPFEGKNETGKYFPFFSENWINVVVHSESPLEAMIHDFKIFGNMNFERLTESVLKTGYKMMKEKGKNEF